MQSASSNYSQAASGAGGTWADPQLRADWFGDGYSSVPAGPFTALITRDDFNRTVIAGFGQIPAGRAWTNTGGSADEYAVSGGYATHTHTAANSLHSSIIDLGDTDFDVVCTVTIPVATASTANISALWVIGRYSDASNYYIARLDLTTSGSITLHLAERVAGTLTVIQASTVIGTHVAGASWSVRFRGRATDLRARAWRSDTQIEPATTWHRSITDTSLTTGTQVGFLSRLDGGNTNTLPVPLAFSNFRAISPAIDDLSGQAGSWTVTHHLDDGLPNSATFVAGVGYPELTADLGPPPTYLTGTPMQVAEFYSPYNEDSPIFGLDRDVAPVTLDHGVITSAGPERIRVFTGQMLDIPVKGGKATLSAVSAVRIAMKKLVQPPAFSWGGVGLTGSWPVSWTLAQCGLYVSPPPRDGCRWWVPMHGSTRPFIPSTNVDLNDATFWQGFRFVAGDTVADAKIWRPTFIDGPFLSAPDCQVTTAENRRTSQLNIEFGEGEDILSQAGNKGRLEFWIKGDATSINTAPTGSGNYSRLASLRTMSDLVSSRGIHFGVNTSRQVFVYANDGAGHSSTLLSDDTLPTDGAWYFVGAAYDITAKKLWVTNFAGTTKSSSVASYVTSSLPTVDSFTDFTYPNWSNHLPVAEIQFSTGAEANVDNFPTWLNSIPFTPGVVMTPSVLAPLAVAEPEPIEAWEFVSQFAQAELASMRTDENDIFNYLGLGWWVREAQQQTVDIFSTEANAATPDINVDPTKILNTIRVSYEALEIPSTRVPAYTLSQELAIPPGTTVVEFPFRDPVVALSDSDIVFLTDADIAAFGVAAYSQLDYVMLNSASDGSGSNTTSSIVSITKGDWHAGGATWTFVNSSTTTWYAINTSNVPALQISGYPLKGSQAFVVDSNDLSVSRRNERSMSVSATSPIQGSVDARRLARNLKMALRKPVPMMEELSLFGEPRRQPGDLVQFDDPSITRASGLWRTQSVTHKYQVSDSEVSYEQAVIVRPTLPICVVGEGVVGESLVGPGE